MKVYKYFVLTILATVAVAVCSCEHKPYSYDHKPYILKDGYMYVQKEKRRNASTEWQLVWEDDFNKGILDTTVWSRIGLFESPKWKVPVENWREIKNCFRYITATDPGLFSLMMKILN